MNKSNLQIQFFESQPNVLKLLDFCKGLAIIGVFLMHYPAREFNLRWGWQGVHIFIVLSAFGLTFSRLTNKKPMSWKQWYIKRTGRILPSYWLIVLVGFVLVFIKEIVYIFKQGSLISLLEYVLKLGTTTIIDLTLLRNFFVSTQSGYPNPALWYVPFIISFYLVFPLLYNLIVKSKTAKNYILVISGAAAIEFVYRAIAIYLFDSAPIAYNYYLLLENPPTEFVTPEQIPYGFFPSRIAEFVLGMMGAIIFVKNQKNFNNAILNIWAAVAGLCIWLAGNILQNVGIWGWIFADFFIAVGLTLFVLNLALACQEKFSFLFSGLNRIGVLSYYIYLTHYLVFLFATKMNINFTEGTSSLTAFGIKLLIFGFAIAATGIASLALMRYDNSKFARELVQKILDVTLVKRLSRKY